MTTPDEERFRERREHLVREYVRAVGISDPRVLEAMRTVPRERFVPGALRERAYDDTPLPIGHGQVITQPSLVAQMVEAARLAPDHAVLEIGTGSGYGAAVLSRLVAQVYTIERLGTFARAARRRFAALGYDNIRVRQGDGSLGWPEHAPYDAIVVTAGSPPEIPRPLLRQLAIEGHMVIPVGARRDVQELERITRTREDAYEREQLLGVRFVPLLGDRGWSDR